MMKFKVFAACGGKRIITINSLLLPIWLLLHRCPLVEDVARILNKSLAVIT